MNSTQEIIELPSDWVFNNFSQKYLSQVINVSKSSGSKFVTIPAGDSKPGKMITENLNSNITIKYKQKENERTCMICSLSSALHYVAFKQLANNIHNMRKTMDDKLGNMNKLVSWLCNKCTHIGAT